MRTRRSDTQFILRKGASVRWYQSMVCPCRTEDSGQPSFVCPVCHGTGRKYQPAKDIKVVLTGIRQDKQYSVVGLWELGTCRGTFDANVMVGNQDRIILKELEMTFTEAIRKGERDENKDILRFSEVTSVIALETLSQKYIQGTDFKISKENGFGIIEWLAGGNRPAASETYSVLYQHHPEFVVWDIPQIRSDGDAYQTTKFSVLRRLDQVEK